MGKSGKKTIKIAIHQPGYHRYCGYFYKMLLSDVFVSLDTVQFVHREWQSRQRFYYQGRYKWLTVPVERGRDAIINKKIVNTGVLKDHWEYLKFVYHKTPFFARYASHLENIYRRQWGYLNDLCVELTLLAKSILGISAEFVKDSDHPSDFQTSLKKADLLIHCIRKVVNVEEYDEVVYLPRAGPIPEDFYLNQKFGNSTLTEMEKIRLANIKVEAYNFSHPVYRQHQYKEGEPFVPNLSIFDLIFNCGERSLEILKEGGRADEISRLQTWAGSCCRRVVGRSRVLS